MREATSREGHYTRGNHTTRDSTPTIRRDGAATTTGTATRRADASRGTTDGNQRGKERQRSGQLPTAISRLAATNIGSGGGTRVRHATADTEYTDLDTGGTFVSDSAAAWDKATTTTASAATAATAATTAAGTTTAVGAAATATTATTATTDTADQRT